MRAVERKIRKTNRQKKINQQQSNRCGPSPHSSGSHSSHFMSPSPKNSLTTAASPLSSPTHQQQQQQQPQLESSTIANSTSAFQIRKQNIVTGTANDVANQNQTNQPIAQTTTLNLHGINFSSLQGAMATFPGLQNVQVNCNTNNNTFTWKLSVCRGIRRKKTDAFILVLF